MLQSVRSRRGPQGAPPEALPCVPPPLVPVNRPAPPLFYTLSGAVAILSFSPKSAVWGLVVPHPGIDSRQLQVSVTFYKIDRKFNETCFP